MYVCLLLLYCSARHALELSRQEKYDQAREAFEQLLQHHPSFCKAWVSYAQVGQGATSGSCSG